MKFLQDFGLPWKASKEPPQSPDELAEEARRLLDNPTLHEALNRVEAKLTETWRTSAAGQREEREAAYALLWGAQQFKAELRLMILNRDVAARRKQMKAVE